jgi:DNA-binding FadR family transcriptional regulator
MARLAVLHPNADDPDRPGEARSRLGGNISLRSAYFDWHMAVALASHNEPPIGFMSAISEVIYSATTLAAVQHRRGAGTNDFSA